MRIDNMLLKISDIDYFFRIGSKPVFVATNGGLIPESLNDDESLLRHRYWVYSLVDINDKKDVNINWDYYHERLKEQDMSARKSYLYSFRRMVQKGFFAYDKDILNLNRETYKLVAWPKNQLSESVTEKYLIDIEVYNCGLNKGNLVEFCMMSPDVK